MSISPRIYIFSNHGYAIKTFVTFCSFVLKMHLNWWWNIHLFYWMKWEAYEDIYSMELFRCKYRWISSKKIFSANQSALWLQVPNSQSFNLFFFTKTREISSTTFKRECTYPKDLNQDVEVMWNQIWVKQEYCKKYTTGENQAARYSNNVVNKNYERLMSRFLCHREWWQLMNVGPMDWFNQVVFNEIFWMI